MAARDGADGGTGSARRRRERRLGSWLTHEQQSIAAVLATVTHHSIGKVGTASGVLRNQKTATRTGKEYETKIRKTPPLGGQPAPLPEVAGWQGRLVRHVMDDLGSVCPFVQILDLPVPQMVENVKDTLRILDFPIAEQVIEVPKISCSPCPSRSLVPEPQSAEQLVEVPTVLSPTRIALRIAEQIVDTPVPHGRGQGRVQGFLPRQSSTATLLRRNAFLSGLWSSFPRLLRNAFLSGLWSRTLTFLLVLALDRVRPHLPVLQMILLGFFALFP